VEISYKMGKIYFHIEEGLKYKKLWKLNNKSTNDPIKNWQSELTFLKKTHKRPISICKNAHYHYSSGKSKSNHNELSSYSN
jgi:hypothetical protein